MHVVHRGKRCQVVALTDLDGTANDESVLERDRLSTVGAAREVLGALKAYGIPRGCITGRSLGEARVYAHALELDGPTICEDGAVMVVPRGYVEGDTSGGDLLGWRADENAFVLSSVGTERIAAFIRLMRSGTRAPGDDGRPDVVASCSSSPEEIQHALAHATLDAARRSCERLASAFVTNLTTEQREWVRVQAPRWGLRVFGDPLHLIGKDADKGRALGILDKHAVRLFPSMPASAGVLPIVFGNAVNDLPLFRMAALLGGIGVLVARTRGGHALPRAAVPEGTLITNRPAGEGMRESLPAILSFLNRARVA